MKTKKIDFRDYLKDKNLKNAKSISEVEDIVVKDILSKMSLPKPKKKRPKKNIIIKKFKSELWKKKHYRLKIDNKIFENEGIDLFYKKERIAISFKEKKVNKKQGKSDWVHLILSMDLMEKEFQNSLNIVLDTLNSRENHNGIKK